MKSVIIIGVPTKNIKSKSDLLDEVSGISGFILAQTTSDKNLVLDILDAPIEFYKKKFQLEFGVVPKTYLCSVTD